MTPCPGRATMTVNRDSEGSRRKGMWVETSVRLEPMSWMESVYPVGWERQAVVAETMVRRGLALDPANGQCFSRRIRA